MNNNFVHESFSVDTDGNLVRQRLTRNGKNFTSSCSLATLLKVMSFLNGERVGAEVATAVHESETVLWGSAATALAFLAHLGLVQRNGSLKFEVSPNMFTEAMAALNELSGN